MSEELIPTTTPKSESESTKPAIFQSLEVGISTVVATIANLIQDHPGVRVAVTSMAPVLGLGIGFVLRLSAGYLLRQIAINGAEKTCEEIRSELAQTPSDRKARIRDLEKQSDEARNTLKELRTEKIKLDIK